MSMHLLSVRRHQRGRSPIGRGSPVYGCTGRCRCGWKGKSNQAPSNGGRMQLLQAHLTETGMRAVLDT